MASSKTFYDVVRSAPRGRFNGIRRNFTPQDVLRLRGSVDIEYTLATLGSNKLWDLLHKEPYIKALGAMTGNQAMQMVRAGLKAIYLSGWQVAADNNTSGSMYPDQSLYPSNSGPELVKRINKTFARADQIDTSEGIRQTDWFAPIVADAEAGFGGALNCFEIMKAYIEVGASGVHYEDQLSSEKKCGHLGGKVLLPTSAHERNVNAARLAADVCGVPTVLVSRTDAESATLITSAVDERDRPFIDFDRGQTPEGFYFLKPRMGLEHCIQRGLAYAPWSDMLWMETSTPDLDVAQAFAEGVQNEYPDTLLSYNCSPSFNWEANLSPEQIEHFQVELAAMGYRFQFVTLAGFHSLNLGMYKLARGYNETGMKAYSELQREEFALQPQGYTGVRHQREVGTGYFDLVATVASGGLASTTAVKDSTEAAQFHPQGVQPIPSGHAVRSQPPPIRVPQAGLSTQAKLSLKADTRISIDAPSLSTEKEVITGESIQLMQRLHERFNIRRRYLLDQRATLQDKISHGQLPDFRKETSEIRQDKSWTTAETPSDLIDRRVEITGPATNDDLPICLKSGAKAILTDFEDSLVPTWDRLITGQNVLKKSISNRRLGDHEPALVCRPRGLHLPEAHVKIDGSPVSASFFDLALYLSNNAKTLLRRGTGPYLYLPKIQSFEEAQLWNDILCEIEESIGVPKNSVKTTVLIEHVLATFQAEEIVYAMRDRITGLNCGRWDYLFSHVKTFNNDSRFLLPDKAAVTMRSPFLYNYSKFIIKTAHSRGIHAMGSMSPQAPIGESLESRQQIENTVRQDKQREYVAGHDGTWVAHPSMVPVATSVFNSMPAPHHQIAYVPNDVDPTTSDLIDVPTGNFSEVCLRHNIRTTLAYYASWLQGDGWNKMGGVMEEAATAEISRSQVWQWLHHKAELSDGQRTTCDLVNRLVDEEVVSLSRDAEDPTTLEASKDLLLDSVHAPEIPDFMTYDVYRHLINHEF